MAASNKFAEQGKDDLKVIDQSVRNMRNWAWCDKVLFKSTSDQHLVGDCFLKLQNPVKHGVCGAMTRYGTEVPV